MINYSSIALLALVLVPVGFVHAAPAASPAPAWAVGSVNRITGKKIMSNLPDGKFHGEKPVTRYELAVALDRFVQYIEAGRKPLHATSQPVGHAGNGSPALKHLIGQGFLPASSPLAKGKGTETVTAQQLSDALAEVTVRLSDRSLPPNKE